jgi:hypothetical protein
MVRYCRWRSTLHVFEKSLLKRIFQLRLNKEFSESLPYFNTVEAVKPRWWLFAVQAAQIMKQKMHNFEDVQGRVTWNIKTQYRNSIKITLDIYLTLCNDAVSTYCWCESGHHKQLSIGFITGDRGQGEGALLRREHLLLKLTLALRSVVGADVSSKDETWGVCPPQPEVQHCNLTQCSEFIVRMLNRWTL